jgi:uncharacterized membrane protein (UPF0127 family)
MHSVKHWLLAAALCIATMALAACGDARPSDDAAPTPAPNTIELRFDSPAGASDAAVLGVELAVTPAERARGLSGRASLAQDAGMLFVFEAATIPSFWMKDTLIPLDLVWIDGDKRVVGVTADVQTEPGVADGDLRRYSPPASVLYVLELNSGAAARLGLDTGDALTFDPPGE